MTAEGEEVLNLLSANGYTVHRLTLYTPLELFRATSGGPYELVWIACHSSAEGFLLGKEFLKPYELGYFLYAVQAKEVFLNSCFSVQFVQEIQGRVDVDIVATIKPEISDTQAWITALYFSKEFVRSKSLRLAYNKLLADGQSSYYWFPRKAEPMPESGSHDETLNQLTRAIKGDPFTGQPGILETLVGIQKELQLQRQEAKDWRANLETRVAKLEENTKVSGSYLVLDRKVVILLFIGFLAALMLLFLLTRILGG